MHSNHLAQVLLGERSRAIVQARRKAIKVLLGVAGALGISLFPGLTSAQTYPTKPVRIVLHVGPGSGVDTLARLLAEKLSATWGKQVIVENKPAAGGIVAADSVARAAPDGHTLFMSTEGPITLLPALGVRLPYDPVRDLVPVSLVTRAHYVLVVNSALPVNSVGELIHYLRANPGKINYASPGNGLVHHIGMELFKAQAGVDAAHIAYKTNAAAVNDLVANNVSLMLNTIPTVEPHVKSGKLRVLAVAWSSPVAQLPGLPTIAQAGNLPGFELDSWVGLFAPAGTPADIATKIQRDMAQHLRSPAISERFAALGWELVGSTPAQLREVERADAQKWTRIIKQSGVRLE
jgi:tripartite-type tricarboxylate transporter receptor subunit TctC